MKHLKIVIITGLSGSGKSTTLAAFEDAGYYAVDNMPVALLPKLLELPIQSNSEIAGLAFVMDLREKTFLSNYREVFELLRQKGYLFEILFLESDEDILIQRFSQTRRHHPLSTGKGVIEAIRAEREQLQELRAIADRILDTSYYNVHDLKAVILDIAQKSKKHVRMRIQVLSFGFKFGVPSDADLIVDVRFIENPYFIPELRPLSGESEPIKQFVLSREETQIFLQKYMDLLDWLIPLYEKEGKAYLTIGVGCTGGRHRSVAIAQALYEHINKPERQVTIAHRDIGQTA